MLDGRHCSLAMAQPEHSTSLDRLCSCAVVSGIDHMMEKGKLSAHPCRGAGTDGSGAC